MPYPLRAACLSCGLLPLVAPCAAQPVAGVSAAPVAAEAEDIIVYAPILDAQRKALEEQRNALNRVDIISADTVGRFPDQNVAAALARLPAVAVQRDQGQERYIQVRGAPNRWTTVKFDGVPVVGVDEGGSTRAFRFDSVPAVLLSSIAVNKSLLAEMPAEAVVAQVDLRSFSPLGAEGFALAGDVGLGLMGLGLGIQRQVNLRASWANEQLGFVLGGANYKRNQTTDNREASYDSGNAPTILDFRSYILERENNGLFARAEWQPNPGTKLFLGTTYTEFNDDEQRNQYVFQLRTAVPGGIRGVDSGSLNAVQARGTLSDGDYRNNNWVSILGGDHRNEGWDIEWRAAYVETENTTYLPILLQQANNRGLRPSLDYDLSDNRRFPIVTLFNTVPGATPGTWTRGAKRSFLDQGAYDFQIFLPVVQETRSSTWTAKLDVARQLGQVKLSGGFQHDDRFIDGNTISASNTLPLTPFLPGIGAILPPGEYVRNKLWNSRFPRGFDVAIVDNPRLFRDLRPILTRLQAAGIYRPENNVAPTDLYTIEERLYAGYGQALFDFDRLQLVAGLRLERFEQDIFGFVRIGTGTPRPLEVENRYTDWFPSLSAKMDLTPNAVLRGSVQRATARPSFGEVRVGASINDTSTPGTVTGGNPLLKPEYTWGVDAAFEYYLPGGGIASVSSFLRLVKNVLYTGRSIVGSDIYDTPGQDRSDYQFISTFNGERGKLYGVEFNYQQQWSGLPTPWDGLGFQGNVALLGGSFDAPGRAGAPFPGTSDAVVNASLFYEKGRTSARISYQWRSDWPDTLGGFGTQGELADEIRGAYGNLDVTLRYALSSQFVLFADFANLTNAIYEVFENEPAFPVEVEQIGRRYMAGIKVNF
ncbi:TonB-dependent receptor [Thermaurantiacus sp.]